MQGHRNTPRSLAGSGRAGDDYALDIARHDQGNIETDVAAGVGVQFVHLCPRHQERVIDFQVLHVELHRA